MKSIFNGTVFGALGFKKVQFAAVLCATLGYMVSPSCIASPNTPPATLKANAPHVYLVKKGDTLWDISGKFLNKPWRWPEIWASNKHVKNPHWIYPGDRLLLCSLNGQPLIGKDEGDGCTGIIQRYTGKTSYKVYPQVRIEELEHSVPVIALQNIKQWLNQNIVINSQSIENLPYVLGSEDHRLITGKGQKIYLRGEGVKIGQRYSIFRQAAPYMIQDIQGRKINAGIELIQVATGQAVEQKNDISTLEITDSYNQEVRKGDLVLPEYQAELPSMFYPTNKNEVVVGGKIIRVLGSISRAAQHSVVTVDRGVLEGAQTGQVFAIYQRGEIVQDPKTKKNVQLPEQKIGHLMLFKTFDHLSYAYVLDSRLPIEVGSTLQSVYDEE
ncbi:LysM peptidoglycan-binding domain-containing protein [Acinetobacter gerneri]|uniref:LysM peptidoglycan-binding domain-containing protein n=1 Tax=Acinetobacter gerneri TaxID=202952 RepID=UPI003AF7B0CD